MKLNSITAYKVVDLTGQTVADIRTDGKKAVVVDDKTNGIIKNIFQAGYVRGKELVVSSNVYKIQPNTGIGIYYFSLSTGDSLAVTTDDKCAAINGEMCDEVEFEKILHLLNTRQITAQSAGSGSPVSMLYNLAEHSEEQKSSFSLGQASQYADLTEKHIDKKVKQRNKPNLSGLNPEHDSVAIGILNTQKVEA